MRALALAAVVLAGCGSSDSKSIDAPKSIDSPSSSNTVNGTLGGATFTARDAIWKATSASGFDFSGMSTVVFVSDFANDCNVETTRAGVANGRTLVFVLAVTDASGNSTPITAAGTYIVNALGNTPPASSKVAEAYFEASDAMCHRATAEGGASGTVTVSSATDPQTATFDVTFDNGDHVSGSFHAAMCSALDPNSTPTC